MSKYFSGHPYFLIILGICSILVACFFFSFQGYTSANGISHGVMDPLSRIIGYSMNIVETVCVIIIFEPIAPTAMRLLEQWGIRISTPAEKIEKYLDLFFLFLIIPIYILDGYTTFMGCPSHWDDSICLAIAVYQLFIFEGMFNAGLWILTGVRPKLAAIREATKRVPGMADSELA